MKKTLAQFVQEKRDNLGLSPKGLAVRSNLDIEVIEDIEAGKELFLSVTALQIIESLKDLILNGAGGLKCPKCGAPLVTKIERMYDLEDNLVLHPKAHCTKCVFQIH